MLRCGPSWISRIPEISALLRMLLLKRITPRQCDCCTSCERTLTSQAQRMEQLLLMSQLKILTDFVAHVEKEVK